MIDGDMFREEFGRLERIRDEIGSPSQEMLASVEGGVDLYIHDARFHAAVRLVEDAVCSVAPKGLSTREVLVAVLYDLVGAEARTNAELSRQLLHAVQQGFSPVNRQCPKAGG